MPGECRRIQWNAQEYRGMQVNARETYGSEFKMPGECTGMTGESTGVGV